MFAVTFSLPGAVSVRPERHTARDAVTARLTLEAWAQQAERCSGWRAEITREDCGEIVARRFWNGRAWVEL